MKKSMVLFIFIAIIIMCAGIVLEEIRADAPTFGGKECVVKSCEKASSAKEYTGCKSACEKSAQKAACFADCSQKMQKVYQAFLVTDCKMDKGLAELTIKCNK